jgi:alkylation response protein AidB-like acyl-CoA dehydrogenase
LTQPATLPGRSAEVARFPDRPSGPTAWQRLCPRPECWQDELLQRLTAEIDSSRAELDLAEREERYPSELIDRLRAAGLLKIYDDDPDQPRTTPWHVVALNDAFGRRRTTMAIACGINALGLLPAWIAADPQQLERICSQVREGAFSSLLLTEQEHGSNLLRNQATAERGRLDDDGTFLGVGLDEEATHYRVRGEKQLINGASAHQHLFTLLRTRPNEGATDGVATPLASRGAHSLFLIEQGDGVTGLPRWRTSPAPSANISGARFDLVVPASARIGAEGEGFSLTQKTLTISRGGIGGFATGNAARAHDLVFKYVRERNVYGEPILALRGIQDHLVRFVALELTAAATSTRSTVWANACGVRSALYTGLTKLMVCALTEEVVEEARICLGGRALLSELPFAQVSRDAQLFGVFDGTSHVMLEELQTRLTSDVRRWRKGKDADRDTVSELRAMVATPPRRFTELLRARSKQRSFLLPLHAARLAALEGEVDLTPLADLATTVYAQTQALDESGSWREDQGLRLQVANTYALIESLTALAEFVDPDRRRALGAPELDAHQPDDALACRYALAWLGNRALGQLELSAAWGGLEVGWEREHLPGGLGELRQRLLADMAGVRQRLVRQVAEL